MDSTLVGRIQDICHFIITFHTPISFSTPHIYISPPPFLPSLSPLSSLFSREFTRVIKIRAGNLLSWPAPPLKWTGHADDVNCVRYSPNGTRIATGSDDNTIRIWDSESGAVVGEPLTGHAGSVTSVAYSLDGRRIISGSSDRTIRIWDADTGAAVGKPFEGHTGYVLSVGYSPDGRHIISGSSDRTIRIWDAETGAVVGKPLEGHTGWVRSVGYSPDGRHIISGSSDCTIRIWDAETGAAVGKPLEGHTYYVRSVGYSPDGRHIVSGSSDKTILVHHDIPIQPSSCNPRHASFCAKPGLDGWVRDSEDGLLYWVPQDCREGLNSPARLTIPLTSRNRSVSLDFDDFTYGTSWIQI